MGSNISTQTVTKFDPSAYSGLWYQLAQNNYIHGYSTSKYTYSKAGLFSTKNTHYTNDDITTSKYSGNVISSGKIVIKSEKGIRSDYWIYYTDYEHLAIAGDPNTNSVWILSRNTHIPYTDRLKMLDIIKSRGLSSNTSKNADIYWNFYPKVTNIEKETLDNDEYRTVLETNYKMQLTVMSIAPGKNIPWERHNGSQFIRVEAGIAQVKLSGQTLKIRKDHSIIIPPNTDHFVKNIGKSVLKLYSIYSPPEHKPE